MQELNKYVERKYLKLYKKYLVSKTWFILLNVLSIFLVALMVILNLYAIKKNPLADTKVYFVVISILSGFIGLLTGLASFFTIRKNANEYHERYEFIKNEYDAWKTSKGKYNDKNKDEILIDEVLSISSGEE